jgi:site-specific recombinase XerD
MEAAASPTPLAIVAPVAVAAAVVAPALADPSTDADATDAQLVALWLHGRALLTIRAYRREAARFLDFVGKPLRAVTLGDLQAFADSLDGKPATRARILATIKSLLSFTARIGARRRLPPPKIPLAKKGLPCIIWEIAERLHRCEGLP